jgi:hypothetical protein
MEEILGCYSKAKDFRYSDLGVTSILQNLAMFRYFGRFQMVMRKAQTFLSRHSTGDTGLLLRTLVEADGIAWKVLGKSHSFSCQSIEVKILGS